MTQQNVEWAKIVDNKSEINLVYTTVPVLKLAYLLISILVTLYTFLWCMGIRPSTSDISSLFIYFFDFDFYNYGLQQKYVKF